MSVAAARPTAPAADPDVRGRVGRVLADFLDEQEGRLAEVGDETAALTDCVRDLLRGGKRLRPAFCYWGWRGAGGEDLGRPREPVVAAAAALELFQAAALMHDDVMDDSDTRRGRPAAHRTFAALHDRSGWRGDGARFGTAGAILAGDLCLAWSDELFAASGLPPAAVARGRRVFDLMRTQLMGGQYLDMLEQARRGDPGDAVDRARRVIRFKSAKYSIEHPLLLGGSLAGADDALLRRYSDFGLLLGEAFQLRDDLLGVFGDPSTTGKPAGDDLREGKRTVLVAFALERATPGQASTLQRLLGDPDLDADGVATLRGILRETGAADRVEALITDDADAARKALADAGLPHHVHEALDRLVTAATDRRA